jgi:hypothetical protein
LGGKKDNLWLVTFIASVSFMVMNCPVNFQKEEIGTYMYAARSEQTQWIQCKGYRCLAILDENGTWRCFATGKELKNVVKVHCD